VLLQVVEATREITDLYELLSSVIHITPRVAGIQACMLYLLEDESTFVPVVASGLKPEQQYEFERWHFTADDVPAFWRLIDEGAATILDEESEDWQLASILYAGLDVENLFADDLLVLVPLIIHGELLGGFLVDYSVNLLDRDDQHRMEIFFNQHLPIIEGIAHQTAVAIDNARLLKAQKEEAYVSVALLQIAQAVVSQGAIDETLEAIVRITPLLIGVKRVGIYLYDDKSCVYELVQAYGLPREFEGGQFVQMEFPLLDEVRERNQIIALPAIVNWDDAEDIHDGWIKFELPGADDVSGNLGMKKPLLIALPLSIQDEVMGVLLVEESDVIIEDLLPGEGSFMRLRSKRLEILTGVSQQTSLAVQNAYLQQDMLEHERLEREIQLAREIQRTFLPRTLPDVPGWDISVRWLTAREVGGDFYDCFLLPENKLGVVIADVADKGMPAALYMTLVRTLIRAAAREISAPADVLAWVNDILVPDAEQGMFITACYLVLSTESGQLTYANAGHNPPLWVVQKDREIQYLTKGGMALGVLEGNRVEEREILLEEGDYMILYTDGLTEAASASYELYGDERLTQTVEKAVFLSEKERTDRKELTANQFIDVLDQSVTEFIQDAPRSDDLTLVVLRRDR
jgi:serine phosphatase RsbU (regulator of sigma subunit)